MEDLPYLTILITIHYYTYGLFTILTIYLTLFFRKKINIKNKNKEIKNRELSKKYGKYGMNGK